jgi:alkanesulfonate monooxygenase SsuD/methylene tetrahydromethanopterin reductase-like flavin-dependent oxidoreductase (luciferase family)
MRVYHFSEQPFTDAWSPDRPTLRVTLPNELCDPHVANRFYKRYLDEWVLADELGLDIMVNEHHATATSLNVSCNVLLSILARITSRARLLTLGIPLCNRNDPVRIAEEMAMVDVISGGRLEMGFIKGVPYESAPANSNPVRMMDRFWESHDLIVKALSTRDGPFNFEGEFFHHRSVNVWPRPFQDPHPPVWSSTSSPGNARELGTRGVIMGSFMGGQAETMKLHQAYAQAWRAAGRGDTVPVSQFAYLAIGATASTEAEGRRRANQIADYIRTNAQVAEPFNKPPGYFTLEAAMKSARSTNPRAFRSLMTPSGRAVELSTASIDVFIECGIAFCGTPDQVYDQICRFVDQVGGLGHLLLMGQGGYLNHTDTVDSMTLFSREVLPRLREREAARRAFAT